MHRDKYVYEFIVIMSSLIPGTEGEKQHREVGRDWPGIGRRVRRVRRGGSRGGGGGVREGGRSWVILLGILASRRSNLRIAPVR